MAKVRSEKPGYSRQASGEPRRGARRHVRPSICRLDATRHDGKRNQQSQHVPSLCFFSQFWAQIGGIPPTWGGQIPPPGDLVIAPVSRRNVTREPGASGFCSFRLTPEHGAEPSIPARVEIVKDRRPPAIARHDG